MPVLEEFSLQDKVAIVTGNGRGWTSTLAEALAEAGADVAIAGLHKEDIDVATTAIQRHGRRALGVTADLSSLSETEAMVQEVEAKLGRVDVLVNNAQSRLGKPFIEVSEGEWHRLMELNVDSVFNCCQAVGKRMLEGNGGRIINVTSILAVRGLWNSVAYCATQGAVHQMTQALGIEWARSNVRVNGIGAGWLTAKPMSQEEQSKDSLSRYIPLRRQGHPGDLCGLLVYLASDSCQFVTGQTIFVDGGALAHP